jgi:hypothetical protein
MGECMRKLQHCNGTLISGFENELALAFILGTGDGELQVIEGTVQYLFILDYPAARKQHSGSAKVKPPCWIQTQFSCLQKSRSKGSSS